LVNAYEGELPMAQALLKHMSQVITTGAVSALRTKNVARNYLLDKNLKKLAPGTSLGQKGDLEVFLARGHEDIEASQRLRYMVFYEEMSAKPDEVTALNKREADKFDSICDHLLVIDHDDERVKENGGNRIVGTYRLLRQEIAKKSGGFYTEDEFAINDLVKSKAKGMRFLELGRSCVLKPYRNKPSVELLWQGIWNYVRYYKMDVMVGCASLEGTDPKELALPLSFLHHYCSAPEEWKVSALPDRYIDMNMMAKEDINERQALKSLPPLIKGYLRLGAFIGDGAVIDHQFNTTDVLIVLPISQISERYFAHFGSPKEKPIKN